jgi:hypothetical protein
MSKTLIVNVASCNVKKLDLKVPFFAPDSTRPLLQGVIRD